MQSVWGSSTNTNTHTHTWESSVGGNLIKSIQVERDGEADGWIWQSIFMYCTQHCCLFTIKHLLPFLLTFCPCFTLPLCMFLYMLFMNDIKESLIHDEVFRWILTDWQGVKIHLQYTDPDHRHVSKCFMNTQIEQTPHTTITGGQSKLLLMSSSGWRPWLL